MIDSKGSAEGIRLQEDAVREKNWKRWGPYLSERQWGTVREDYSKDGEAWYHFPHDHAPSRAYRWGEDGLLGMTDRQCRFCFAVSLWNTKDPILKERLFGLTGPQGNHGEDVKECYYYLDSTPTHSYMKALYKYPQSEFPYQLLIDENKRRDRMQREFELADTGVFEGGRYFDVFAEYAKADANDVLIRLTIANRSRHDAPIHVLPTFWFRNTWIWGCRHEGCSAKPLIKQTDDTTVSTNHESLGNFHACFDKSSNGKSPNLLFTENETNSLKLFGTDQYTPFVKDAFHRYLIHGQERAVNPKKIGTKVAGHYDLVVPANGSIELQLRFFHDDERPTNVFGDSFQQSFGQRKQDADEFFSDVIPVNVPEEHRLVTRQAYAGLLWTKQFYHYIVKDWLRGDSDVAEPPASRWHGRNRDWLHVYARDIISMPDKWEYPWFAAWDLAFHMVPFSRIDPEFSKKQLLLLLREWYMHPNGQIPAYEYGFHDVNPPVHAWACWRVYQHTKQNGHGDREFLAKVFQRLLLNFTWWVNRVDGSGNNVFAGGFLGLDNIGVFDRSKPLPTGGHLEQADGTAWMAFYCVTMLSMSVELASEDAAYAEMASKFLDHFVRITDAINTLDGHGLWDEEDELYYDYLRFDNHKVPLKIRSLVSLLPLIAVDVLELDLVNRLPEFKKRLGWFLRYRHDLAHHISFGTSDASNCRLLLAIPSQKKLRSTLRCLLDEKEFLSPYGIRSLSKRHLEEPYEFHVNGEIHTVKYTPGESDNWMFGGNSNWRGPIWFPANYLLIEALERYHDFYGEDFQIECPTDSGNLMNLKEVSQEINRRLATIFTADEAQSRACHGRQFQTCSDPHWNDLVLFYEYFHGETGEGLGASHQTGWTALIANCIEKLAENSR